jgi:hypothetical protein
MASALIHVFNPLEVSEYILYTVYSVHVAVQVIQFFTNPCRNPLEIIVKRYACLTVAKLFLQDTFYCTFKSYF